MATNLGEAITLRTRIEAAEKAVHVTTLKKQEATNAACFFATKANAAEEALQKADPKKPTYNDLAAAFHSAEADLAAAVEAENLAWAEAARAEARLSSAKSAAKAAYAI